MKIKIDTARGCRKRNTRTRAIFSQIRITCTHECIKVRIYVQKYTRNLINVFRARNYIQFFFSRIVSLLCSLISSIATSRLLRPRNNCDSHRMSRATRAEITVALSSPRIKIPRGRYDHAAAGRSASPYLAKGSSNMKEYKL